jgi:pimeloyl-ACP methyl ester carboxylesterase
MPDINADNCTIHVEVEGPEHAPVLMLSNSLGTNLHMWDDQVAPFARHFRLVRYDRRGHGKSGVPKGPYSMDRLGRDVLAILDGLGIERVNWCGLSMGGMVGQWLGAHAPNRLDKLILSNTSCYFPDKAMWEGRIKLVRDKGLAAIVDANMERWFTKAFRERSPNTMERIRDMFLATVAADQRPDPGHCRQARSGHNARSRRVHRPAHAQRSTCGARHGAHRQHGAAGGVRRYRVGIFVEQITKRPKPSPAAVIAKLMRRRAGMLAEKPRKMRGV